MTSYSFSLLRVFTKTKVVPGVGSNVLVKLIIKPFVIAHKQRYCAQTNGQLKVLCTQLCMAKRCIMVDVQMRNLLQFYQLCRKQGLGRKIGGQVLR